MSEETMVGNDVEQRAREMGWVAQEEFKGDVSRWVDAETFVERGETFLPILQATTKKQKEQLSALERQIQELVEARKKDAENLQALQDLAAEQAKLQYNRALETLKAQKKEAVRENDSDAVVEIDEAIAELRAKGAPKNPPKAPAASQPANIPVDMQAAYFKEWAEENPWVNVDTRKTAAAAQITMEIHRDEGLRGKALLSRVTEEMDKLFGEARARAFGDKMEGSRGGAGTSSSRTGGVKGWESLPADAKEAANKMEARLVGPGKIHKDRASWRTSFVKQYYGE